jgi:hypothetical protein
VKPTTERRLGVALPFTYERSTVDAFGWKPKKTPPLTIDTLAKMFVSSGVVAKVDELAAAVEARQLREGQASEARRKLSEHLRKPQLVGPGRPQRALHVRDEGFTPFFEFLAKRREAGLR